MAKDGGVPSLSALAQKRVPPTFRPSLHAGPWLSPADTPGTTQPHHVLQRCGQASSAGRYGSRSYSERMCARTQAGRGRVLFKGLPSPQAEREVETSDRPLRVKQVHKRRHLHHGHASTSEGDDRTGDVGHLARHEGRIPSCPHSRSVSKVLVLPSGQQTLYVSRSPIWPKSSTMGIHGGGSPSEGLVSGTPANTLPVSRRLAEPISHLPSGSDGNSGTLETVRGVGPSCEHGQIGANAGTVNCFPGGKAGLHGSESFPHDHTPGASVGPSSASALPDGPALRQGRVTVGPAECHGPDDSVRAPTFASTTVVGDSTDQEGTRQQGVATVDAPSSGGPSVVDVAVAVVGGDTVPRGPASSNGIHGCLPQGVGHSVRPEELERNVAKGGPTYKLARTANSTHGASTPAVLDQRQGGSIHDRQHIGDRVSQEAGRHTLQLPTQVSSPHSDVRPVATGNDRSTPHRRKRQRARGHGVSSGADPTSGMDPNPTGPRVDDVNVAVGPSDAGVVRQPDESQVSQIRVSLSGSGGVGSGRINVSVADGSIVCVSPVKSTVAVSQTPTSGGGVQVPHGSAVVTTSAVGSSPAFSPRSRDNRLPIDGPVASAAPLGPHGANPPAIATAVGDSGEEHLRRKGFSTSVIKRIQASRALSTRKHYRSQWDLFVAWATEKGLDPLNASLPLLTDFMEYLFKVRNVSVRTILNYKSAISFYWKTQRGFEIPAEDNVIRDLVKGFKRDRPLAKKHVVDWDIRLVLDFYRSGKFKNWGLLSDKELTLKTLFLIALASGKRRSELHALSADVRWIKGEVRTVELTPLPDFVSKTHLASAGLGALRPIQLKALDEFAGPEGKDDKLLCPVRTLRYYLDRTHKYRSDSQKRLFISYRRGTVDDVSKQTISAYLKEAILLAYQANSNSDTPGGVHVKAHSIRHVATSLAALKHYSLEDVMRAGAWTTPNVFLSFYMQDFSVDHVSKLSRLGGVVAAGTVL